MNEYQIVWTSAFSGLGIVISALLYSLGGREDKYLRRWVASFVIATTANITAFLLSRWSPWLLTIFPAIALGYHLGYGSEDFFTRLFKRIVYIVFTSQPLFCKERILLLYFETTLTYNKMPKT